MLTEVRFWAQVAGDAKRTIICSPELESRIKGYLRAAGLDGFHSVVVQPYVPDYTFYVVDEQALNADLSWSRRDPFRS